MTEQLSNYFDRVTVVSLKRRADRLASFREQMPKVVGRFAPETFEAIDGSVLPLPFGWQDGGVSFSVRNLTNFSAFLWSVSRCRRR